MPSLLTTLTDYYSIKQNSFQTWLTLTRYFCKVALSIYAALSCLLIALLPNRSHNSIMFSHIIVLLPLIAHYHAASATVSKFSDFRGISAFLQKNYLRYR